ncbi:MAG TPA: NAD-dependent epimerase/dehydratase family protein [Pirellulales bacterium]
MNALVTGAAGFLGRHIVQQLLARGEHVTAFCRTVPIDSTKLFGADCSRVKIVAGDLRKATSVDAAIRSVETVYHTASIAGLWGPWRGYRQNNVVGTQNVIAACRRNGVRRLVYTSSPSVVFTITNQGGVDESIPYTRRWLCHYPHSKALAEQAVLAANGANGLLTCSLRPHLLWGPGDRHLLPRLLARARAGQVRRVGDGNNLTDIVYVENAAIAHLQAADALDERSPVCGRAYFISQGEPVNCWQWVDDLLGLAGLPPVQHSMSFAAAWRSGLLFETAYRLLRIRKEPPMTRFLAAQLGREHWFDISAARRDFGYRPLISTAEGMQRLKDWLGSQARAELAHC